MVDDVTLRRGDERHRHGEVVDLLIGRQRHSEGQPGGVALMPLYVRNLLPATVMSRPLRRAPPVIDLSLGYHESNTSPLLKKIIARIEYLQF